MHTQTYRKTKEKTKDSSERGRVKWTERTGACVGLVMGWWASMPMAKGLS